MSTQNDDQDNRVVAVVLISAVLLAVGLAVGFGVHKAHGGGSDAQSEIGKVAKEIIEPSNGGVGEHGTEVHVDTATAPAVEAASSVLDAASANVAPSSEDASVVIENGVVKFYFASGKSDLASGATAALSDVIIAGKNGKHLALSGFHDASGDPAKNAALAKQRALSVRNALVSAGVAESAIELKKPEETMGSGNAASARRVEVTILD